jgi:hypothetical protein
MFNTRTLPRHLDKSEHYDQMRAALEQIATGNFPGDVSILAKRALSAETQNAEGLTLTEFLAGIEAAKWPTDDVSVWLGYWSDGWTPQDAIAEEGSGTT